MKVLVLGGTGAMGVHLVRILAERGETVYVTSRSRSGVKGNVTYLQGNAHEQEFLDELLSQKWDIIVDFMVYSTLVFQQRYSQLLAVAKHYVFLSSARVYANSNEPIVENSPRLLDVVEDVSFSSSDEYSLAKARQENLLYSSGQNNWTIIRPYITYDDERLQLGVLEKEDWLYRAMHGRSIVTSADIQTKTTTLTYGEDVAKAICALIGKEKTFGEAFHITADQSISWKEVSDIYIQALSKRGNKTRLVEHDLDDFLAWRKSKYQVVYDRLYNRTFNNEKIKQYIDTKDFVDPKVGLINCLDNFLDNNGSFKIISWREEAIKDSFLREKASFSEIPNIKQKIQYTLFRILPSLGRLLKR